MIEKKYKTYLAGPIDKCDVSNAKVWRDMITEALKKIEINVFNPLGQFGGDRLSHIRGKFGEWNQKGNIDAIRSMVSDIVIPPDLDMVVECDFVTVWIPKEGKEICGTYGEVTLARYLGKPVYIVTNRSLKPNQLPNWLIGCSTEIFENWKSYMDHVKQYWSGVYVSKHEKSRN